MQTGLTKISEFKNASYAIIFIHGFRGNPFSTWRQKGTQGLIDTISNDEDLSVFDKYTFGYRTGTTIVGSDIRSIANQLNSSISVDVLNRKLVFVAHSMGGLVVMRYILDRYNDFERESLKNISGVVFLGAPIRGSKLAFFPFTFNKQVQSMREKSSFLNDIEEEWNKFVYRGGTEKLSKDLQYSFKRLILYGTRDRVVHRASSNPFFIGAETYEVDETHANISKSGKESITFKHLKKFLLNIVNEKPVNNMVLAINGYDKQKITNADYTLDWTEYFNVNSSPRVYPKEKDWENKIIPNVAQVVELWEKQGGNTKINIKGKFSLASGLLIGTRFSRTKGVKLCIDHYGEIWETGEIDPRYESSLNYTPGNDANSKVAIVALSVSKNIQSAVCEYLTLEGANYKKMVNIIPSGGPDHSSIKGESEANSYSKEVKEAIDKFTIEGIEEILLFISAPLSLSVIVGHWLTATCPIQTFEFTRNSYIKACRI